MQIEKFEHDSKLPCSTVVSMKVSENTQAANYHHLLNTVLLVLLLSPSF